MQIELSEVDKQALNKALVESVVGTALTAAVQKELKSYKIDDAIRTELVAEVRRIAGECFRQDPDLRERVRERVKEAVNEDVIASVLDSLKLSNW